ncbi:hypothetical protein M758_UG129900 [Ceratodon purpureus]|nr:hypothetical protein M758_UG129900 [Ceratodon purpureus]
MAQSSSELSVSGSAPGTSGSLESRTSISGAPDPACRDEAKYVCNVLFPRALSLAFSIIGDLLFISSRAAVSSSRALFFSLRFSCSKTAAARTACPASPPDPSALSMATN